MYLSHIPEKNDRRAVKQHLGLILQAFVVESMSEVDEKLEIWKKYGYKILSGPRKTGHGYYEFEALDPDNNRLEITTLYIE
jgi:lactoylglutathione lyase